MNFVLNSSLGASCGDFGNFGRFADSPVQSHAPNFQKTPQPPPQILEFEDLKNADSANQTQIAESRLDSATQHLREKSCHSKSFSCHSAQSEESKNNPSLRANPQDLRGNPPCDSMSFLSGGLPRSHSLARNDENIADSADLQNLVNLNPCEALKTKFLLLLAFAKSRVPLHLVIARKSVGFSWQSIKQ